MSPIRDNVRNFDELPTAVWKRAGGLSFLVAVAGVVAACHPDVPADEQSGDSTDALVGSDPFDPASCPGPAIDETSARSEWGIDDVAHELGRYSLSRRTRSCDAAGKCSAWVASPVVGSVVDSSNFTSTYPLKGTVNVAIGKHDFYLSLVDDLDPSSGTGGIGWSASPAAKFEVAYTYKSGFTNSPTYYPRADGIVFQTPILRDAVFRGKLTATCLQLVATNHDGPFEEEIAIFGTLAQQKAPAFVAPETCFPAGTTVSLKNGRCCAFGTDSCAASRGSCSANRCN
jgi:hypothetical protein